MLTIILAALFTLPAHLSRAVSPDPAASDPPHSQAAIQNSQEATRLPRQPAHPQGSAASPQDTIPCQGIKGRVYLVGGNRMPAPGSRNKPVPGSPNPAPAPGSPANKPSPGSPANKPSVGSPDVPPGPGVAAEIYVYELTNISQVSPQGSPAYFSSIPTRLIRSVRTDSTGRFTIALPAGQYSIFTKKGDLLYAGRRDEKNNIAPVEVLPGKMTKVECSVESDHKPVY